MSLKGVYIEDDKSNICVIQELFGQEGLEILSLDELPKDKKDIYPLVAELHPDFLLIDHELNKLVGYTGYEALCEIRKQDNTIFAVLLTNFAVEDFKAEFGIYDMEVRKGELNSDIKLNEISTKIRRACKRADEAEIVSFAQKNLEEAKARLDILRQIHDEIKEKS